MGCSASADAGPPIDFELLRPVEYCLLLLAGKIRIDQLGVKAGGSSIYRLAQKKLKEDVHYFQGGLRTFGSGFGNDVTFPLTTIQYIFCLMEGKITLMGCSERESRRIAKDIFVVLTHCRGSSIQTERELCNYVLHNIVVDDMEQFMQEMIVHAINFVCSLGSDLAIRFTFGEERSNIKMDENLYRDLVVGIHCCISDIDNTLVGKFDWMACMMRIDWPDTIGSTRVLKYLIFSEIAERLIRRIPPFGTSYLKACIKHAVDDALVFLLYKIDLTNVLVDDLVETLMSEVQPGISLWKRIATASPDQSPLFAWDGTYENYDARKNHVIKSLVNIVRNLTVDRRIECSIVVPPDILCSTITYSSDEADDSLLDMILSDRMRKRYCDQNLTYFDPNLTLI